MNITNEPKHNRPLWKKYFADIVSEPAPRHEFRYEPVFDEHVDSEDKIKEIVAKYEDIEFKPIKTDKEIKRETKETLKELKKQYNKKGLGMVGENRRISE